MTTILALKLLLVPALIAGITLAGRRWGPSVAGWLSAFPVVSAPVLFFIALEQGPAFATTATTATLSAVLAILVFGISYCWVSLRYRWPVCLVISLLAYALAVGLLNAWHAPLGTAAGLVLAALLLAPRLYPQAPASVAPARSSRGDLLWRMLAGAVLVLTVTGFATQLGARLSGLLAMFPVMATVLAVFSQRLAGAGFTVRLLRGMVYGYWAFACFCLSLALALPRLPLSAAFALALGIATGVQALTRLRLSRPALTAGSAGRA
ncbi:MAG: hypothetical protein Q8Q73_06835 [Stagnimonas sp.]|nr:hypothetical protein [Stagnimonas sp.]